MKKSTWIIALAIFLWLWFPTLEPTDVVFFSILARIGMGSYVFYSIIILIIAYNLLDGKTLKDKLRNLRGAFK